MSARIVGYVGGLFGILYLCAVCCASEEVLQVHIIPHSHCDVGWKKTVDEYYETQVHWILHNATRALQHQIFPDVTRKFNWDVQTYFQMWYEKLSESRKSEVQTLVANGQLDFVGFGWVQSDEAVADAFARVMQMTEGHNYIAKQFPNFINTTRVAWQIDPFGASSISPVLFSLAGYDGLVHERIPRAQQAEWKAQHKLQYQWTGNPANLTPPLWSHNLGDPTNDYCTPGDPPPPGGGPYGFDWEADDDGDPNKDPIITPENLKSRADVLVQIMHTRSKWLQPGVPLLFPFGCDFRFQDAEAQFVNMDKLIHYINENSEAYAIHLQYSLVSEWFQAVQATAKVWPSYKGDFLPYNNEKNNFWSGFYTSRPDIKRASRYAESLVRYAELLHGITSMKKTQPAELSYHLDSARQNISIAQHHDAITGTSPDTTMIDYLRRLRYADMESAHVISQISEQYICGTTCNSSLSLYEAAPPSHKLPLIPITTDDQSELLPLVVANPLAWRQHQFVQFRTETLHIKLIMANKTIIPLQAVQETNSTQYLFSFIIDMLPLDTIVLYITSSTNPQNLTSRQEIKGASVSIHNSFLEFEINAEQGTITSITDKTSSDKVFVNQEFIQYYSPHSSAYSMKPDFWNILYPNHTLLKVEKAEGPLYSQIYVWFTDYFQWSLRLINTNDKFLGNNADFTALIGPVLNDTEVSIRFDTDWDTKGIWYSDNGMAIDTHTRVDLPYMDPTGVGSNFHSLKNTAFIQHSDGKRLVVLTAQSAGVSSLSDGQLEIMMNRRCGSWNDHTKVQLYYRFLYDSQSNLPSYQPQVTQQLQYPPVVLIGTPSENMFPTSNFQLISESLPENIHLFSLVAGSSLALGTPSTCGSTSVGIRLQNLSTTQTITVDPSSLFECSLCSREERGLTFLPLKNSTMNPIQSGPITMDPMALRTWVFSFNPCN